MKVRDFPAYRRIHEKFETEEFHTGTKSTLPIYSYEGGMKGKLTPGHYVGAIKYSKIRFCDIPQEYLTRDFFVNALSSVYKDVVAYVKEHLGTEFDRDFFKDHIATSYYALEFEENCFEYMPLDYIDEEMVSCAMLAAVKNNSLDRRGDFDDWFYSVAKRKPEVLTQDFWTLGARLFASKRGTNKFLSITPVQYRTKEYYFAMCLENNTPVMEDFPEDVLTTPFLVSLINLGIGNIKSFSAEALEKTAPMAERSEKVKFWQAVMLLDGSMARYIPLNDERITFFLEHYDKDSFEYRCGFKDAYKAYLKAKEKDSRKEPKNHDVERASELTLLGALCGIDINTAVDIANADLQAGLNRTELLPIKYIGRVPQEFCKKYNQEEYLCEIYKKLGIEIIDEYDSYYYRVKLPQNLRIEGNYRLMDGDNVLLEYRDVGPFYDRDVDVTGIYCSL